MSRTIGRHGITVTEHDDYFRVVFDRLEVSAYQRTPEGFLTAEELLDWLCREYR